MRLMRFTAGVAMAALVAGSAIAQTAPAGQAAGTLDPASEQAPATAAAAEPEFTLADGIVATVNDQIITGFDLRQRMLSVIAMSQVQPTEENIPAIQQQALQALIEERLQAQEIANYETLTISDEEVDREIAAMAQEAGTTPENYLAFLAQGGIRPNAMREQLLERPALPLARDHAKADEDEHQRRQRLDNITDWSLKQFTAHYKAGTGKRPTLSRVNSGKAWPSCSSASRFSQAPSLGTGKLACTKALPGRSRTCAAPRP